MDDLRRLHAAYPADAIPSALRLLAIDADAAGPIATRLDALVSNYAVFRQAELRPLPSETTGEIEAVRRAAAGLEAALTSLSRHSRSALAQAVQADGKTWIDPSPIEQAEDLLPAVAEQCAAAIEALPSPRRGQPPKGALHHFLAQLARIYSEATGERPARKVVSRTFNEHSETKVEAGRFRAFADCIFAPLGAPVSDRLAKEAIMAFNASAADD